MALGKSTQPYNNVWNKGILYNLKRNIPNRYYLILKTYLSDRYFRVKQNNSLSNYYPTKSGIPSKWCLRTMPISHLHSWHSSFTRDYHCNVCSRHCHTLSTQKSCHSLRKSLKLSKLPATMSQEMEEQNQQRQIHPDHIYFKKWYLPLCNNKQVSYSS